MAYEENRARRVRTKAQITRQRTSTSRKRCRLFSGFLYVIILTRALGDLRNYRLVENSIRFFPRALRELRRHCLTDWGRIFSESSKQPKYEIFITDLHVVVITLRRSITRSRQTLRSLKSQAVSFKLYEGIDGLRELDERLVKTYAGKKKRKRLSLTAGMDDSQLQQLKRDYDEGKHIPSHLKSSLHERLRLGCYMSHVSVWQELFQNGLPFAVILEDDVILAANFSSELRLRLAALPLNWDLLYLNGCFRRLGPVCGAGIRQARGGLCTFGYILSSKGAGLLLQQAVRLSDKPIDHVLDQEILTGRILAFHSDPPLVQSLQNVRSTLAY